MRNALLASAVMALLFVTGCPCGAYNGAGDKVYARGTESLILCANGGFVANLTGGPVEGRYQEVAAGQYVADRGDTGALAFDFEYDAAGNLDAAALGAMAFAPKQMDQTALDHADVQCTDLETRSWWTAQ